MATLNPAVGLGAYTTTLADLRARVLRRTGYGAQVANPPPGVVAEVNDYLQSAQTLMARKYPVLRTERFYTWTLIPGTRFYDLSGDDEGVTSPDPILDPQSVTYVAIEDTNGTFDPLFEGIDPLWYTQEDQRGRPERYEIRQAVELMPSPDEAYKLHIKGHTQNFAFAGDSDVCTVDPELLFLLAVANMKANQGKPDAGNYFTQATSYLGDLIAGKHGTARYVPNPDGRTQSPPPKPVLI